MKALNAADDAGAAFCVQRIVILSPSATLTLTVLVAVQDVLGFAIVHKSAVFAPFTRSIAFHDFPAAGPVSTEAYMPVAVQFIGDSVSSTAVSEALQEVSRKNPQ